MEEGFVYIVVFVVGWGFSVDSIYLKTFNQVDEIQFLQRLQDAIISSLEKDDIQNRWKEHFGEDDYYYSKAQFFTVSSKVALCLAVNGNSFSIENYKTAFNLNYSRHRLVIAPTQGKH